MDPSKQLISRQQPETVRDTVADRLEVARGLQQAARRNALAGLQLPGSAGLALLGLANVYAGQARLAFKMGAR